MTKADLVEKVTQLGDLTRRDGEVIVETIFDSVIGALQSGDKIEIRGFGSFRIRERNPRIGRNPRPATASTFRQARALLQTLQGTTRPRQSRRSPQPANATLPFEARPTQPLRSTIGIRRPGWISQHRGQPDWRGQQTHVWTQQTRLSPCSQSSACTTPAAAVANGKPSSTIRPPAAASSSWTGPATAAPVPLSAASENLLDLYAGRPALRPEPVRPSESILLGSGFGAAVAIRYASLHSEAVLGLILCQPAGLIDSKSSRTQPLSACVPTPGKIAPGSHLRSHPGSRPPPRTAARSPPA